MDLWKRKLKLSLAMQGYNQDDLSELVRTPHVVQAKDVGSMYSVASSQIISGKEARDPSPVYSKNNAADERTTKRPDALSSKAMMSAMHEYKLETPQMGNRSHQRRQSPPPQTPDSYSVCDTPQLMMNSSITSTDSTREESEYASEVIRKITAERKKKDHLQHHQRIMVVNQKARQQEVFRRQEQERANRARQQARELHVETDNLSEQGRSMLSPPVINVQQHRQVASEDSGIIADRDLAEEMMKDPYIALRNTSDSSLSQYNTPKNLFYNLSGVLGSGFGSPEASQRQIQQQQQLEEQLRQQQQKQQREKQQQKQREQKQNQQQQRHQQMQQPKPKQQHPKLEPPISSYKPSPPVAEDEISLLSAPPIHKRYNSKSPPQPGCDPKSPSHRDDDNNSVFSTSSSVIRSRLFTNTKDGLTKDQEMAYYHYVCKRSVLQLVTEDMMSEKWRIVDYALFRLCEICCNDDIKQESEQQQSQASANRIRFIKAGGHALIVGVMKKFAHVADIQTSSCRFIQNFICRDKEGAFSELLGSVDGIERVMAALQRFPASSTMASNESTGSDAQVHRYACGALTALVCSSMKMVQRLMKKAGNLRIFLAAMKVNMETNKDAVGTCRVLHFISTSQQYCAEIASAGGVEDMVREMEQYPKKQDVQLFGCGALANVVSSTKQPELAQHLVNNLCGAHLIGTAMRNFPEVEKLQEKGVHAIYVLSSFKNVQGAIKIASGLSSLGIALERFPENKAIQELGSAAMKRLLETGR